VLSLRPNKRSLAALAICLIPMFAGANDPDLQLQARQTHAFEYRHGHSPVFELKYCGDFSHFDYVNPGAPRGGELRLSVAGTFNSFNHWAGRGRSAEGLTGHNSLLYDRLLVRSADEPAARYGLLAEGVAVDDDFEWVAFKLRDGAYFHDGRPITVDDVTFTFELLKEHGSAMIRTNLRDVIEVRQIGEREILFINNPEGTNNRNVIEHLGSMEILPKHYWQLRDPTRTTTTPPLGSGPYRIADHQPGRYVLYERDPEYWANDLPALRGRFNFDRIKFDYYRDESMRRQALKNGAFDLMLEQVAKSWTLDYDFDGYHAGLFIKDHQHLAEPAGLFWAITWNLRRSRFQDHRVREALWLLFDFEYTNRVQRHNYYDPSYSLFQGSTMAHRGLPSPAELDLLEPFRDLLPERVFTEPYAPPPGSGYGYNRQNKMRAIDLFREAGWEIQNGRLVSPSRGGEQFHIEFIVIAPALVRLLMPYMATLERLGIATSARAVEQSNFLNRMQQRQFDATRQNFAPGPLPSLNLRHQFGSTAAQQAGSINWPGINNAAVDHLINAIIAARTEDELLAATRALDRVLLWNFYYIPGLADTGLRHVYWNRFGRPNSDALHRPVHIDTWWYDDALSKRLDEWMRVRAVSLQVDDGAHLHTIAYADRLTSEPIGRSCSPVAHGAARAPVLR
jgi:microcin C transport system substrate-binding protein